MNEEDEMSRYEITPRVYRNIKYNYCYIMHNAQWENEIIRNRN